MDREVSLRKYYSHEARGGLDGRNDLFILCIEHADGEWFPVTVFMRCRFLINVVQNIPAMVTRMA